MVIKSLNGTSRIAATTIMADPRWNLRECLEVWSRLNIGGIGLSMGLIDAYGRREAVALLNGSPLTVSSIVLGSVGVVDDAVSDLRPIVEVLDVAAELGADCVYAIGGARQSVDWEQAFSRLVDRLGRLVPLLRERGLRLAIEPLHPLRQDLSFLNMFSDTLDLLRAIGEPEIGCLFDFWHLWWQRSIIELVATNTDRVFAVQLSDHKAVTLRTQDRAMTGEGIIPIDDLVAALERGGYRGFYELEIISDDNATRGYEATLQAAAQFGERRLREFTKLSAEVRPQVGDRE